MIKKVASYVAIDVCCKAIGALSIPVFSWYISPAELGLFGKWFTFYNLFSIVIGMGISTYFIIINNEELNKIEFEREIRRAINSSLIFLLAAIFICFFMVDLYSFYVLGCIVAFASNIYQMKLSKYRVTNDIRLYAIYSFCFSLCTTLIPLYFVASSGLASTRIMSFGASVLFVSLYSLFWVMNTFYKNDGRTVLVGRRFYRYGLPVALVGVFSWIKSGVDIHVISNFLNDVEAGYYFFAFQLVSILLILGATINRALMPELISSLKNEESNYYLVCICCSFVLLILAVILYLISYFFVWFFSNQYLGSLPYLVPLLISAWFYTTANVFATKLLRLEKTLLIALSVIVSSVIHLLFVYFSYKFKLLDYIAWVNVLSSVAMLILVLLCSEYQKASPIDLIRA